MGDDVVFEQLSFVFKPTLDQKLSMQYVTDSGDFFKYVITKINSIKKLAMNEYSFEVDTICNSKKVWQFQTLRIDEWIPFFEKWQRSLAELGEGQLPTSD